MRLLIYHWNSYMQYDLYEICKESGITYEKFEWRFKSKNCDEEFSKWFAEHIQTRQYDALVSVNYYPVLSDVCQKYNLKYVAWCYDAPLNVENIEETLNNDNNYVFLFDRAQYLEYLNKGFSTVHHLPLGVNQSRLQKMRITDNDVKKYRADVSFIGRLYESSIGLIMDQMNDYTKGYIKCMMDMQSQIYGYFLWDEAIDEALIKNINDQYQQAGIGERLKLTKEALLFAMASEITRKDRLILLNLFGKRYDTHFYSMDDGPIDGVKRCGTLDYIREMPQMFVCSKINLNPSLRIIKTGIPMRAFDIMGAGGFLLSNWQEELMELYEEEKEIATYSSYEEAMEKADFYLKHDDIREQMALQAREKTLTLHTLQNRLQVILKTIQD